MEKSEYGDLYQVGKDGKDGEVKIAANGQVYIWLTREDLVKMLAIVTDAEDEFLN